MASMADCSVDSLVTDPPAGISFMGQAWDHHKGGRDQWIAWLESVMRECLRVMKPGAHGLVWALPRTSHWTATACENAGFEVRDVVIHLFGTGFPKSMNVGNGFGTALKPASEHWVLIRKPCSEKTVAANVLRWGTGALAIDRCRIEAEGRPHRAKGVRGNENATVFNGRGSGWAEGVTSLGRWPSNLVLSPDAAAELDRQSGTLSKRGNRSAGASDTAMFGNATSEYGGEYTRGDSGGASRFFYIAKASRSERGAGNAHPCVKPITLMRYLIRMVTPPGGLVLDPFTGSGTTGCAARREGMRFLGIEREAEYVAIAQARIKAENEYSDQLNLLSEVK